MIKTELELLNPSVAVRIEIIKTSGDVKTDPLSIIGGKGVFTKELEDALLDRRIDLAVHSLKDLPTTLPDGLVLSAICKREDPRDALVLSRSERSAKSAIETCREGIGHIQSASLGPVETPARGPGSRISEET